MIRSLQYAFIAIIVTTVGFSLYQWNASRASTQKTAPNNGLVGYWKLDEGTGTTTLDASGNNYTGTLTSGPTWVNGGKVNKSVSFDGTNDYITMGDQSLLEINNNSFSFGGWFYLNAYPAVNNRMFLITKGGSVTYYEYELSVSGYSSNHLSANIFNGAIGNYISTQSTTVPPLNTWFHVMAVWDKDAVSMKLYYDGVLESTSNATSGAIHSTRDANFEIGRRGDNAEQTLNGLADEVRVYNRALSATEVMTVYNLNATRLNTSENSSLTSGLVGLWSFNGADLSGTTAYDRSSNTNNGTLTNGPTTTIGKVGQALNFDGSNDCVSIPHAAAYNFAYNENFSVNTWVKIPTTQNNTTIVGNIILQKWVNTGGYPYAIRIYNQTYGVSGDRGKIYALRNDGTNLPTVVSSNAINDNAWHLLSFTKNGSTLSLYVDGVLSGTATDTTTGTTTNGNPIYIGEEACASYPLTGQIDDTRIYNRALSAGEIQSLYDLGASDKVNSSVSQSQGTGRLDSGLAGYWKLDDASGTTATDSSTNANNGTLTSGPTWGTGKIGGSVDFTGTKYITIPNSTPLRVTGDMTVSFWMYLRGYGSGGWNPIVCKFSTDISNEFNIRFQTSSTGQFYSGGSGAINTFLTWDPSADAGLNNWVHVVARRNITAGTMDMWFNGVKKRSGGASGLTDATTQPLQFGGGPNGGAGGVDFNGLLDEVRVYNRAISDDEIAQLYRLTTPTGVDTSLKGYWSFDGNATNWTSSSAGTVADLSGSGNTGTLTNMSRATSPTFGQIGQAMKFTASTNVVSTPATLATGFGTGDLSFSAWVKTTGYVNQGSSINTIIARQYLSNVAGYGIGFSSTNLPQCQVGADGFTSGGTALNDNVWHFLMLVRRSNVVECWQDGVKLTDGATTSNIGSTVSMYFGNDNGGGGMRGLAGSIDEVRLYNRALSAGEISALYNSGR